MSTQIDEYGYVLLDGQSGVSGSTGSTNQNNNSTYRHRRHKKTVIGWIVFLAIAGIILSFIVSSPKKGAGSLHNEQTNQVASSTRPVTSTEGKPTTEANTGLHTQDGFVFPDSDKRYLTEDEIATITADGKNSREEIIQYAINEIYARNHYSFQTETWKNYYSSFSWYSDEGLSMEEAEAQFNEYEYFNMKLLVNARNK